MRSFQPHRTGVLSAAALMLAACSGGAADEAPPPVSDNAEFNDLVNDARAELGDGNLVLTQKLLDQAREIEPENPELWVTRARLHYRKSEHLQALEAADLALKYGPDYVPALFLRAQIVRDAFGMRDALPWFEAAAQADPDNPEILADYAATLGELGRHKDMLQVVRELQNVSEDYPQVFYLQAVLAARAGMPVLAASLLSKSGLVKAGVPAALLLDAVINIQQQTPDTAITTLDRLAEMQPANMRVRELMAQALWISGRDDELIDRFGEAARAADASPYLTMMVGRSLERRGDRELAAPFIEQALKSREVQLSVLSQTMGLPEGTAAARRLIGSNNAGAANSEVSALLATSPGSANINALAGDAALAAGETASAMARFTRSATVRRPWPLTRKMIATTRAMGDDKAADTLLARAVINEPRNTEALLMLAQRRAEFEDWDRVSKLSNLVFALGAGNDPRVLDLQAKASEALGRDEQATTWDLTAEAVRPGRFVR